MPRPNNDWTIKNVMILIALAAVILSAAMQTVKSYVWMVRAGW